MLEALDAEVVQWLAERHDARFALNWLRSLALRAAVAGARALIAPRWLPIDARLLESADDLLHRGRACRATWSIDGPGPVPPPEVSRWRGWWSSANAEAEFAVGALLDMFRLPVDGGACWAVARLRRDGRADRHDTRCPGAGTAAGELWHAGDGL